MHHATPGPSPWHLIVPIKHADWAKTRLDPPEPLSRADLARAMAADTLAAVCAAVPAAQVLAVTSDPAARARAVEHGALVLADPGEGLNEAIAHGNAWWRHRTSAPLAALLGDLPALGPDDLSAALRECLRHEAAVVPDRDGTGTVLLSVGAGRDLDPRFGQGSAARHATSGVRLDLTLPRLRTDVDDVDSLAEAARLGVGQHTAAVLARACLPSTAVQTSSAAVRDQ